ncbi:hypothetical protein CUR178_06567 [Leishmania enriettii]|uniref:Nudix hydrolase domain-containing protein n=1 Tax=Leishmania enriettii TaxID=5663 RepID=A0A836HPL1_LEIEN|nr:hypothetical protein CUR178_06567 [Leishmania enriettii]
MPPGVPGVDMALLLRLTRRLAERRLRAYYPCGRRAAAALVLRFDDDTQRTLTAALRTFRAATARCVCAGPAVAGEEASGAASSPRANDWSSSFFSSAAASFGFPDASKERRIDPLEFFEYLAHHNDYHQRTDFVDASAPSSLQLLLVKRANVQASQCSGRIVFPGGCRDAEDHNDFDTVCRGVYEAIGFPLQRHHEFLCLGRLPDYRLHSRIVDSRDLVQARFLFLHVGEITPTVQLAAHEFEDWRWVPLRMLTAAHVERRRVVYPLPILVNPQDADARLMLGEVLGNTCLYFTSLVLPSVPTPPSSPPPAEGVEAGGNECRDDGETSKTRDEGSSAPPEAPPWRVWGFTYRTVCELLALGRHPLPDWPLVESNSRLLQYGVLFPMHGYYELLYQLYWWRAWMTAKARLLHRSGCASGYRAVSTGDGQHGSGVLITSRSGSPSSKPLSTLSREQQRWERVLYGCSTERRCAVLPASADAMLFAAPESPIMEHVVSFAVVVIFSVFVLYTVASVIASACAALGSALGRDAEVQREGRRRAYRDAITPSSVTRYRRRAAADAELRPPEKAAGRITVTSADDPIVSNIEAGVSHSWAPRQLNEDLGLDLSAIADEAALFAELQSSGEAPPHGEGASPDCDSAAVEETACPTHTAPQMSGVQQHLTATARAEMDPTLTGVHAGADELTVGPSQLMTTTGHLTQTYAASAVSAVTITECRSGGDCCRADLLDKRVAGKERGKVAPAVTDISLPAERPAAAAMPATVAELSQQEELEVIMRRYRTQATANQ